MSVFVRDRSAPIGEGVPPDQAESLRRLVARAAVLPVPRSNRPVLLRREGAPIIAVASGKGGVGKSTISVSLAIGMNRLRPTVLVDADLGTANADVLCGLTPTRRLDAELFRAGGPDLASLLVETPWGFGLVPGAAGVSNAPGLDGLQRAAFIRSMHALGGPGDAVLVDLGAGISAPVIESVAASDLGVVITTPEPAALADAYALIKCVTRHRGDERPLRLGLVVNMAESRSAGRAAHDRIDRVCRRFLGGSMPLLGVVRRDKRVAQSSRRRVPLLSGWPGCPASRDLLGLSEVVSGVTPRVSRCGTGGHRP